jgi:hypothetical protein
MPAARPEPALKASRRLGVKAPRAQGVEASRRFSGVFRSMATPQFNVIVSIRRLAGVHPKIADILQYHDPWMQQAPSMQCNLDSECMLRNATWCV